MLNAFKYTKQVHSTHSVLIWKVYLGLAANSYFAIAVAAVYRFVSPRFEWYFCILPALGTFRREHLPLLSWSRCTASIAFCFSCLPAGRTPLRLVGITLRFVEFLLFRCKSKSGAAIGTLKGFFLKSHWWPPLLDSWSLGHHYLRTHIPHYLIT